MKCKHGCGRPAKRQQMCDSHRKWLERHGTLDGYEQRTLRDGTADSDGYVRIRIGGVRYLQHRYVMEQKIGRRLLSEENVHHINGVRHDNRPENLELWNTSQPKGQRIEDKVAWAKHILDIYG